ncbi:MAG TPA: hypothetical protein DEP78_13550 [Verrucomicrobiales bacterium]|nr:hypothetical protein [Verrucomicrobiales bacterium]
MLYGRQAIKVMDLRWEATAFKDRKKAPKTRGHNNCAKSSGPNSKKGGAPHDHQKAAPGVHSAWSQVQS